MPKSVILEGSHHHHLYISPYRIKLYCQCPRFFRLWNEDNPDTLRKELPVDVEVIARVILAAYTRRLHTGAMPTWKWVRFQMDRAYRGLMNKPILKEVFQDMKDVFPRIYQWYHEYMLSKMMYVGYPGVSVKYHLERGIIFKDAIDIIGVDPVQGPVIVDIVAQNKNTGQLPSPLRSIDSLAKIWGVRHGLALDPVIYKRIVVKPKTIGDDTIYLRERLINHVDHVVPRIIRNMYHNIDYPAIGEKCSNCYYLNNGCGWKP